MRSLLRRYGFPISMVAAAAGFVFLAAAEGTRAHHEKLAQADSAGAGAAADADAAAEAVSLYIAKVEGMMCATNCAPRVKEALEKVEGVEAVEVDFDAKLAVIRMRDGYTITPEACDKAFGNSGYFIESLKRVERPTPPASGA